MPPQYSKRDSLTSTLSTEEDSLYHSRISDPDDDDDDNVYLNNDTNNNNDDDDDTSFLRFFLTSKGPPHIIFIVVLVAFSVGSTVGVVPAVMTDRYARLNHNFAGEFDCSTYPSDDKPDECLQGNQDAQNASAWSSLVSNMVTFTCSSVVGSISDTRGRRDIIILGMLLSSLPPLILLLTQLLPTLSPFFYYSTHALSSLVSWISIALSSLSDVIPEKWRAAGFGLVIAGFSLGFSFAPSVALMMSHEGVSALSWGLMTAGLGFAVGVLPETLSEGVRMEARRRRSSSVGIEMVGGGEEEMTMGGDRGCRSCYDQNPILHFILRPVLELSILNRNKLFRFLATIAFLGGMVSAADQTLLVYYLEEQYSFDDKDISILFVIWGTLGIVVQSLLLKPLVEILGDKLLLILTFANGTIVNVLYGIAPSKKVIFIACALNSLTGLSYPTISAIKSKNVDEMEQGRIQGALSAVASLASAVGPLLLRAVSRQTSEGGVLASLGGGAMYIFAAMLYAVATVLTFGLPRGKCDEEEDGEGGYRQRRRGSSQSYGRVEEEKYGATEMEVIA